MKKAINADPYALTGDDPFLNSEPAHFSREVEDPTDNALNLFAFITIVGSAVLHSI